jgi:hypothetical protein
MNTKSIINAIAQSPLATAAEAERLSAGPDRLKPLMGAESVKDNPYRLKTREELANRPPIQYLVDGLIPAGASVIIYGLPASAKTFIATDIVLHIQAGKEWSGRAVHQGLVVYVLAEGQGGFNKRLDAWEQHNGAKATNIYFLDREVNLSDGASVTGFIAALKELPDQPVAITIDTFARCFVGGEENSAKEVGFAINQIERIRRETGAAVLLVHHTAKNGESERGSSAVRGAADTMIKVKNDSGVITVSCEKQKDAAPFSPSEWRLFPVAGTDSCVPVVNTQLSYSDVGEPKWLTPNRKNLLTALQTHGPLSHKALQEATGLSGSSVTDGLDSLQNHHMVFFEPSTRHYSAKSAPTSRPFGGEALPKGAPGDHPEREHPDEAETADEFSSVRHPQAAEQPNSEQKLPAEFSSVRHPQVAEEPKNRTKDIPPSPSLPGDEEMEVLTL